MKKVIVSIWVLTLSLLIVSCGGDKLPERKIDRPIPVKTIKASEQPTKSILTYSGTVEPVESVRLSTKISGWVRAIHYQEGQAVLKGTVVVALRNEDLKAKLSQAEAKIAEAEAHYQNVKTNLKRIESLFAKNAATQKELDDIRAAFTAAESQLQVAREGKKEIEEMLRYTILKAPFDGVVTRKMMQVGDLANPGQPIVKLENIRQVKIVAKVPESDVAHLNEDMPVNVHITSAKKLTGNKELTGTIDQIIPSADQMSRQFDIKILIDNSDGRIKPGMFARISVTQPGNPTILVPAQALFRRGQLEGLFVVDADNIAHLRWIRSGANYGDTIEVLAGLNPDEMVVIDSERQLYDGQTVEVSR